MSRFSLLLCFVAVVVFSGAAASALWRRWRHRGRPSPCCWWCSLSPLMEPSPSLCRGLPCFKSRGNGYLFLCR
ncbi:hypothetical protein BVRB_6g143460 [Beta vulgaris subsp. vulgaris]|nr:hypothetical protein BVRB_6g143460 [Beta vulgaris subsp. vulgaris]